MTDRQTIYTISARVGCDPRTVQRFLDTRDRVRPIVDVALRRAVIELGLPLPAHRAAPKQAGAK